MDAEHTQSSNWRIGKRVLAGIALLYVGLLLFVQASEWTVRHRAERLLVDFRTVRAGVGTWSDAEKLRSRWSRWETHYDEQPCTPSRCEFEIEVLDWMYRPLLLVPATTLWVDEDNVARVDLRELAGRCAQILLRDHLALVRLDVSVRDGLVDRTSFSADTNVPKGYGPGWEGPGPEPDGYLPYKSGDYVLDARVDTVLALSHLDIINTDNPDYIMQPPSGCTGCMGFFTRFGLSTKQEDIAWLTVFDLSCMTRWRPCTEAGELMPEAWKRYKNEHRSAPQ